VQIDIYPNQWKDIDLKRLDFLQSVIGSLPFIASLSIFLVLFGSIMQGCANRTFDALSVAFAYFFIGSVAITFIFKNKKQELVVFMINYGICIFAGGLAQSYSLHFFNNVQSTVDSFTFFSQISAEPPFTTLANLPNFNSPLAVLIWQQIYKFAWWLKLDFGVYIAVMFNALIVGISGSITINTAREIYGNDIWRLKRVSLLFSSCGLFILFGSVLIRDCFTTFFNILVLWSIVNWIIHKTFRKLIFSISITAISSYAMAYLRVEAVLLFGLYWVLALFVWLTSYRLNFSRLIILAISFCVVLLYTPYIINFINLAQEIQSSGIESYSKFSVNASSEGSLGLKLIVNQPLPIRLLLGSVMLLLFPIPLWAYFNINLQEIYWFCGYNGIYQIFVMPLVLSAILFSIKAFRKSKINNAPLIYLTVYFIINLLAITATSLEQRHFYQFMPSVIILSALPDTRDAMQNKIVRQFTKFWVLLVLLIHLLWVSIKVL